MESVLLHVHHVARLPPNMCPDEKPRVSSVRSLEAARVEFSGSGFRNAVMASRDDLEASPYVRPRLIDEGRFWFARTAACHEAADSAL